jgi:hypothetical protein
MTQTQTQRHNMTVEELERRFVAMFEVHHDDDEDDWDISDEFQSLCLCEPNFGRAWARYVAKVLARRPLSAKH